MKSIRFALGSFLFMAVFTSPSVAQLQRTFVSGLGDDGNPCSRTAPCRTFGQAISQTNAGGEVVALDSAGYGPFTISKSVTVQAPPGVYAGISVFSGDGIDINAGGSDTVVLRGLTLNYVSGLGSGIAFNTGGTLHVESCVINGFTGTQAAGVSFTGPGNLEVKDSILRRNAQGISVRTSSNTAFAAIDHTRLESNIFNGLQVMDGSKVTIRNSVTSGNGNIGFAAESSTSVSTDLNIESCLASNNAIGILGQSNSTGVATVRVSNSTVTDNGTGLENFGSPALILSRGNNTVEGNLENTVGTIGTYTAK